MPGDLCPGQELMGSVTCVRRAGRYALLTLLLMVACPHETVAQRLLCSTIRPGETAGLVARRISGDAADTRQPWFQILNPVTRRFVPKSGYDHIHAGWQACIVNEPAVAAPGKRTARGGIRGLDSRLTLWGMLVALIAVITHVAASYLDDRAGAIGEMRSFGETFVREFERPLIPPGPGARAIQSRLRFVPHRRRFDVLLAPNAGRLYPNLADHQKNVEYDVGRVAELLRKYPFVPGRPYASGRWVVVPFELRGGQ